MLCTLVAAPGPESRLTPKHPVLRRGPMPVLTQVRLCCFPGWRSDRPAGRGQWAMPGPKTFSRPDGISGRPSKPAEAKSCPRGPIWWGWSKSPDEQDIPALSLFASWLSPEGPRAADRQGQPRQLHWAGSGAHGLSSCIGTCVHTLTCTHTHTHRTPHINVCTYK